VEWHLLPVVLPIHLQIIFSARSSSFVQIQPAAPGLFFRWRRIRSLGRTAIHQNWAGVLVFCFLPATIIPHVSVKVALTELRRVRLAASVWQIESAMILPYDRVACIRTNPLSTTPRFFKDIGVRRVNPALHDLESQPDGLGVLRSFFRLKRDFLDRLPISQVSHGRV